MNKKNKNISFFYKLMSFHEKRIIQNCKMYVAPTAQNLHSLPGRGTKEIRSQLRQTKNIIVLIQKSFCDMTMNEKKILIYF